MSSFALDSLVNSSFIDVFATYFHNITAFIAEYVILLKKKETAFLYFENLSHCLYFDEFQWTLFKTFSAILFVNILLICVAWRIFGKNICERFMKPGTSKTIEELKASVSRLKLPKEHSPRI